MTENLKASIREAAKRLEANDVKGALAALEPLVHPTTEPVTRVEALRIGALAKLLAGDRRGAREFMDEAVQASEPLGPAVRGRAFERRALVLQDAGDVAGARRDLASAASAFGRAGDAAARAQMEDRGAMLAAATGDLEEALLGHLTAAALLRGAIAPDGPRVASAAAVTRDVPSQEPLAESLALVQAGGAAHLHGARDVARAALERAVHLLGPLPQGKQLLAQALHNLGVVVSEVGDHATALAHLDEALRLDAERPRDAAATRLRIALVARRKGDLARAREEAARAEKDAALLRDAGLRVDALLELSSVCMAANEGEAALASAKDAIEAAKDQPGRLARATLHAATCAKMLGKKDAARAGFEQARALAEKAGDAAIAAAAARELQG